MIQLTINMNASCFPQPETVGTLGYDVIRGNATYRWEYDPQWNHAHRGITLSGDLHNAGGPQHASGHMFCFLQDAMPDRWGKRLIDKRERLLAEREGRLPRHLTDMDYLTQIDDTTRMGALQFRDDQRLVGTDYPETPVPPLTRLRDFVDMAHEFEREDAKGRTIREEWLHLLYRQGSSLGGARPKANVRDVDGSLWIAKIPSVNDDYDVALWEYFAHRMAAQCGIEVPSMRLQPLAGQRYHTLLSRRFDRQGDARVHYASAMTLAGLRDGADADSGNGYLDIVDVIVGNAGFVNPQSALEQLYRRVAFSIIIGNHDDHFRNHGFLLTDKGWVWSPAFDINPSDFATQSLLISRATNDSSLDELLSAAGDYMLSASTARTIIDEVRVSMRSWRDVARTVGIAPGEISRFAARIDSQLSPTRTVWR